MKVISIKNVKKNLSKAYTSVSSEELNEILMNVFDCDFTTLSSEILIPVSKYIIAVKSIKKYLKGQPVNKIFKKAYFYGNQFFIDKNVLAPRQDTELLIEIILKETEVKKKLKILDLCTGSGIIAITLAQKLDCDIDATDISAKALKIAKRNAKNIGAKINFAKSNMFEKVDDKYDIIISNPPYISKKDWEQLDKSVKKYDPKISLIGGKDGLKFFRDIANNAKNFLKRNGKIILEIGDDQKDSVTKIFEQFGFTNIECFKDYNNKDRALVIKI